MYAMQQPFASSMEGASAVGEKPDHDFRSQQIFDMSGPLYTMAQVNGDQDTRQQWCDYEGSYPSGGHSQTGYPMLLQGGSEQGPDAKPYDYPAYSIPQYPQQMPYYQPFMNPSKQGNRN